MAPVYKIPALPPDANFETVPILKAAMEAHRRLAELKGSARTIPNQGILTNTLSLQEARASSEIENIVTTQDEVFQADLFPQGPVSPAAKEVAHYRDALRCGFDAMERSGGLITNNTVIEIFRVLKGNTGGFRSTPGTELRNDRTGETVYVPPQDQREITGHMSALERFINDDDACALDPLIKMAIMHHQFESIHPFPDGNGRIGRILNVLYLTKSGLLDTPILYLSRAITRNKNEYYRLLQSVRDNGTWEEWVIFMLNAVSDTSRITLGLIEDISALMADYKIRLRGELPKIYSQDLLNNMFRHPYTRIEYVEKDLGVTRQTASRYLDQLAGAGFLQIMPAGKSKYFINVPLVQLFVRVSDGE